MRVESNQITNLFGRTKKRGKKREKTLRVKPYTAEQSDEFSRATTVKKRS